ncbi:hypothetical protein M430DRAFT_38833 [Amorphotheca resinae ATCC 22711]|uniref:Uncharacterized protein n=1 Tax=Amorphotheca resinae ATCC 22711 TaxID=857342 RepID=A0A2T3BFJ5_AMORE|nr:hypothetical protein M430DRAFT_38833 [Amorphotheca resinae ATCC 22711]PSS28149.1 hypothetical protein M430DRAFT_38833 [Amorphotheca resinae ATCC 22711]
MDWHSVIRNYCKGTIMTFLRHIYLAYQVKKTSVVSQYLLLFRMLFNRERPPYGHGANDALKTNPRSSQFEAVIGIDAFNQISTGPATLLPSPQSDNRYNLRWCCFSSPIGTGRSIQGRGDKQLQVLMSMTDLEAKIRRLNTLCYKDARLLNVGVQKAASGTFLL